MVIIMQKNLYPVLCFTLLIFSITFTPAAANPRSGDFGLSASVGSEYTSANLHYNLSKKLQIGLGWGFQQLQFEGKQGYSSVPEEQDYSYFIFSLKYYFDKKRAIYPYIGTSISYATLPDEPYFNSGNEIYSGEKLGFTVYFGAEAFVLENFSFWLHAGLLYEQETPSADDISIHYDLLSIKIFTAAIGASFYI